MTNESNTDIVAKDEEISKLESIEEWLYLGERDIAKQLIEELKDRNIKEIARSLLE